MPLDNTVHTENINCTILSTPNLPQYSVTCSRPVLPAPLTIIPTTSKGVKCWVKTCWPSVEDWTSDLQTGTLNALPECNQCPLYCPSALKSGFKKAKRHHSLGPEMVIAGSRSPVSCMDCRLQLPGPPIPFSQMGKENPGLGSKFINSASDGSPHAKRTVSHSPLYPTASRAAPIRGYRGSYTPAPPCAFP